MVKLSLVKPNMSNTGELLSPWFIDLKFCTLLSVRLEVAEDMPDVTANEGERVSMECQITGYPTPAYMWYKDSIQIIPDETRHYSIKNLHYGNK